jgi:hypothetical protein
VSISQSLPFRSPIAKLLRFFRRSRDTWKAKCKAAKRENKSLKYRLAKMTESRDRWKAEVRDMRNNLQAETTSATAQTKNGAGSASRDRRHRHARPVVGAAG